MKQRDVLSFPFDFALEYAVRKMQESNLGLDKNGVHQVLAYADDVNLIDIDNRTVEINTYLLLRGDCKPYPHNVNFRNIFLRY